MFQRGKGRIHSGLSSGLQIQTSLNRTITLRRPPWLAQGRSAGISAEVIGRAERRFSGNLICRCRRNRQVGCQRGRLLLQQRLKPGISLVSQLRNQHLSAETIQPAQAMTMNPVTEKGLRRIALTLTHRLEQGCGGWRRMENS